MDIKLLGPGSSPTVSSDGKTVAVFQSPHNVAVIDISSKARLASIPLSDKAVLGHTQDALNPDATARFIPNQNKLAVVTKGYWSGAGWDDNNYYRLQVVTIEPPVTRTILEYTTHTYGGSDGYVWPYGIAVSNDGAMLAFAGQVAGVRGIFTIDSFGTTQQIGIANGNFRFPAFSPDDSFVYFVEFDTSEIFRVRQNGLQFQKTTLAHPRKNVFVTGLDISRKTGLMLVSYENAIIVQSLDGNTSTVLEIPIPKVFQAQWGPDGRTIVFSSGLSVSGSVYSIQLDLH